MQYMLMAHSEESGWGKLSEAEQARWMKAYGEFVEALNTAGVLVSMGRLQPSATAMTVRVLDGAPSVQHGPLHARPEQFVGYFIVEVADMEAAVAWAKQCPAACHGAVEVRALA